jgi:hypothetical protein
MTYENINFREANMTYHDNYFYFFDGSFDVLYQKVGDGDTAFTYPLTIDLDTEVVYDGFDIDGPLNTEYWNASPGVTASGGKVRVTSHGSAGSFNGINKILLAGNFDISIDFDMINSPSTNAWGTYFRVQYDDQSRIFQVVRSYHSGAHRYYRQYWNGTAWTDYSSVFTTDTSGKLRITRSGNTFTGYYWNGTSWVSVGGGLSKTLSHKLYPSAGCGDWSGFPLATADMDNFSSTVPLGDPVQSEHDGINFWTLQSYTGNVGVLARRWQTLNQICELKSQTQVIGNYDTESFTVEHYHTALSTAVSGGDTIIQTDLYSDITIVSGSILTIGPNSSDLYEDVNVISVSGVTVTLSSGIQNTYIVGNDVHFYNNLWIFNSYAAGTVHKVDARTGSPISTYSGVSYDDVSACTFSRVNNVVPGNVDALVYINDSSLTYLDIDNISVPYDTMTIDTLKPPSTYIKVYDVVIDGNNIYRLQDEARYYGTNYSWSTYNYVISTIRRFVGSVSLSAYPTVLPANGVNVSELSFIVQDQYGDGMISKPVSFTDTDINGFITTTPTFTEYFFGTGEAVSAYKAGLTNGGVTIVGTATQHD